MAFNFLNDTVLSHVVLCMEIGKHLNFQKLIFGSFLSAILWW